MAETMKTGGGLMGIAGAALSELLSVDAEVEGLSAKLFGPVPTSDGRDDLRKSGAGSLEAVLHDIHELGRMLRQRLSTLNDGVQPSSGAARSPSYGQQKQQAAILDR